ncbi:maleylpyruvate isomerase family mycothiol-dependent enzyme [Nocardia sp. NRRL S-836]|uniref:maleylpyruvate isomerase family mycothiol-dependent enzyme n=1 Tax=Nocardia sp. NRRL S-836 TaxID=1519492 RepID=UPI000B14276B|nr:maleylpyruvate isomerase family mycothiol-dependent enzyme [Nocardia sp. NRRL S-836]
MDFVAEIEKQAAGLRAAALAAGPTAPVPTCPKWTVHDLVWHQSSIHAWAAEALVTPPSAHPPRPDEMPESGGPAKWDDLLVWWDEKLAVLLDRLRTTPPDTPAWTFGDDKTASFWARRQAHETSIHHLDALHARGDVPSLLFSPEFAADGVDEYFTLMLPRAVRRVPVEVEGTILFHAADAGRTWEVRLTPGEPVVVGPPQDAAIHEDATVAGTADAVYRAVWGRPGHAIVSGDQALLDGLRRP